MTQMQFSNDFKQKVTEFGLTYLFKQVETWVATPKQPKLPSPYVEDKGECIYCSVHKHVVLAHGYVSGLVERVSADGSVPAGLGGTIEMARVELRASMAEIVHITGTSPAVDTACRQLSNSLPEILARLDHVKSREEWLLVNDQLAEAEKVAYLIPEAIFRREEAKPVENSQQVVILGREEAEILDQLAKVRRGEISQADGRKYVADILGG